MAARKRQALVGTALPAGIADQPPLDGEVLEQVRAGTTFATITQCRQEMARLYWQGERGKMPWPEVAGRINMMDKVAKTIIAERALRVAERASEHAPLVGVQIVAPESKVITSEEDKE